MDMRKRRKHSVEKLPIGTIVVRRQRRDSDGTRIKHRVIKVRNHGSNKFIHYARYLWEKLHGPVPTGKRVLHRDGDMMNDDPANLMLGSAADVVYLFCHADPEKSAENHRRHAAASAEQNRERGIIRRATTILPTYWYAVDIEKRRIINNPVRERHQLFDAQCVKANGAGWQGWSLGWPGLRCLEATVVSALADGKLRHVGALRLDIAQLRASLRFCAVDDFSIASALTRLHKHGYVARPARGMYRIHAGAIAKRGPVWPYIAVRGCDLIDEEEFRGFDMPGGERKKKPPAKPVVVSPWRMKMEDFDHATYHRTACHRRQSRLALLRC